MRRSDRSRCADIRNGAAPNPFWDLCTLVICKPRIRSAAKVGDWVAGTGSKYARLGDGTSRDLRGRLIYAMRVTEVLTMEEYDSFARTRLPEKIPDWHNKDHRRRVGDAIYAFSNGTVIQREGVHGPENQTTDLNGGNALLSREFVYFGANAPELPSNLAGIAQNRQGHRTTLNDPYVDDFASWVRGLAGGHASVLGKPLLDLFADASCARWCAAGRGEQDDEDDEIA